MDLERRVWIAQLNRVNRTFPTLLLKMEKLMEDEKRKRADFVSNIGGSEGQRVYLAANLPFCNFFDFRPKNAKVRKMPEALGIPSHDTKIETSYFRNFGSKVRKLVGDRLTAKTEKASLFDFGLKLAEVVWNALAALMGKSQLCQLSLRSWQSDLESIKGLAPVWRHFRA